MSSRRLLRVLYSVPPPSETSNPYTTLLARGVGRHADVLFFNWPTALFRRYDIFHVHWPETLVRHRDPRRQRIARMAAKVLLLRLRWRRTPVVMTVHNQQAHEPGDPFEQRFIERLERLARERIYINAASSGKREGVTILHGHYRDWYLTESAGDQLPSKTGLLYFGSVRAYKGVESLIAAVATDRDLPPVSILGAASPEYARKLADTAAGLRVTLDIRRVPDHELAAAIRSAAVVVLPYRDLYNSGALLLALSLGTHVLVPSNAHTLALQEEFGEGWVSLFDGLLNARDLRAALEAAEAMPVESLPDMSSRDWIVATERHLEVYRRVSR